MKGLTQYIFELSSATYKAAAKKANELGQKKRAARFKEAEAEAKKRESKGWEDIITPEIKKLTFNLTDITQGFFNPYEVQSVEKIPFTQDEDSVEAVYIQLCGYGNTTDAYEKAIEDKASEITQEYAQNDENISGSQAYDEAVESWRGATGYGIDYFVWLRYDPEDDTLYYAEDESEEGPRGYYMEPEDGDYDEIRVGDRKTAINLAKLAKLCNPNTKLDKNNFIA